MKKFYVYILANKKGGTLYVGITSDLPKRVWQHRNAEADGFTKRYSVKRLVYFEVFDTFEPAVQREKSLKRWREESNRDWNDLYAGIANG